MRVKIVSVRASGLVVKSPAAPHRSSAIRLEPHTSPGLTIDPSALGHGEWSRRVMLERTDGTWHGGLFDATCVSDVWARHIRLTASSAPWPASATSSWNQCTGRSANIYYTATTTKPYGDGSPRKHSHVTAPLPLQRNAPQVPAADGSALEVAPPSPGTSARPT